MNIRLFLIFCHSINTHVIFLNKIFQNHNDNKKDHNSNHYDDDRFCFGYIFSSFFVEKVPFFIEIIETGLKMPFFK